MHPDQLRSHHLAAHLYRHALRRYPRRDQHLERLHDVAEGLGGVPEARVVELLEQYLRECA